MILVSSTTVICDRTSTVKLNYKMLSKLYKEKKKVQ